MRNKWTVLPMLLGALAVGACDAGDEGLDEGVGVVEDGVVEMGDGMNEVGTDIGAGVGAVGGAVFNPALDLNGNGVLDADEGLGDIDADGVLDRDEVYP
jgi:hypothetical protein